MSATITRSHPDPAKESSEAIQRRGPATLVMLTAALIGLTAAVTADAAPRRERSTESTAPRAAGDPVMAIVSIKNQRVTIYDAEGWILRAPVSSGTTGRETPAGIFSVVQKDKDHHSNLYDDAWMPNMLRITWSGIALHGGPLPGYAASHGCVRMPMDLRRSCSTKYGWACASSSRRTTRNQSSFPIRRCSY